MSRALAVAVLLLALPALPAQDAPPVKRPNIVFIFSDDHAAHAISAYGSRLNRTPQIDRLAQQGVLFTNCFCGNSICGPSRATVLTGKHSHANGFRQNGDVFDGAQQTFPKLLRAAGYTTAMIGKWHLRTDPTGFDHWEVLPGQGQYYNPDFRSAAGKRRIDGYVTEITTDLAIEWLEKGRDKDKPFVLMCQHKAPHRPWLPGPHELAMFRDHEFPEPDSLFDDYSGRGGAAAEHEMGIDAHMTLAYDLQCPVDEDENLFKGYQNARQRMTAEQLAAFDAAFDGENAEMRAAGLEGRALVRWKFQRYMKNYLRCVAGVDKSVGRLLDYLDAHGLADDTVVVYSADQGFYLGEHGWFDKRWMYEESLRMPLLVRWPGHAEAGSKVDALVQNIDFAPTFLEMAGVPRPADLHGQSLVPLLQGERPADWRLAVYYRYYESRATHRVAAHYGVRTDRYKLIHYPEPEHAYWELFDLQQDPHELKSVYADPAYAKVVADLGERLAALRKQYGDAGD